MDIRQLGYYFIFLCLAGSPVLLPQDKAVRGCNHWGFYAEFLWVLNHLEWCASTNKVPVVYWDAESAYYSPNGHNGSTNVWEYYFEPVSNLPYTNGDFLYKDVYYRNDFTTISFYSIFVDQLYLLPKEDLARCINIPGHNYNSPEFNGQKGMYPLCSKHWYDKSFRRFVKEKTIDPFIKLKPSVQTKIDNFYTQKMMGKKTVGIHLRGRHLWGEVIPVPPEAIFEQANKWAPLGYQFLVATDQENLLAHAKRSLKGPVIWYEEVRAQHSTAPTGPRQLSPQQGEDVLVEGILLSKCDYFIHTLSQMSTAVLYFNPELEHTLLY